MHPNLLTAAPDRRVGVWWSSGNGDAKQRVWTAWSSPCHTSLEFGCFGKRLAAIPRQRIRRTVRTKVCELLNGWGTSLGVWWLRTYVLSIASSSLRMIGGRYLSFACYIAWRLPSTREGNRMWPTVPDRLYQKDVVVFLYCHCSGSCELFLCALLTGNAGGGSCFGSHTAKPWLRWALPIMLQLILRLLNKQCLYGCEYVHCCQDHSQDATALVRISTRECGMRIASKWACIH